MLDGKKIANNDDNKKRKHFVRTLRNKCIVAVAATMNKMIHEVTQKDLHDLLDIFERKSFEAGPCEEGTLVSCIINNGAQPNRF